MATKKSSGTTAKKISAAKRPAAKKIAPRKSAAPAAPQGDRLTEVARTIGSTMGDIVAKTKRALNREPGRK